MKCNILLLQILFLFLDLNRAAVLPRDGSIDFGENDGTAEMLHELGWHGHQLEDGVKEKRCNNLLPLNLYDNLVGSIRNPKLGLPLARRDTQAEQNAEPPSPIVGFANRFAQVDNGLYDSQVRYYTIGAFGPGPIQKLLTKLLNVPKNINLDRVIVLARNKSDSERNPMVHPVIIDTAHVFSMNDGSPAELELELHNVEDFGNEDMDKVTVRLNKELDAAMDVKKKMIGDSHLTPDEIDKIIHHAIEQHKTNKFQGDRIVGSRMNTEVDKAEDVVGAPKTGMTDMDLNSENKEDVLGTFKKKGKGHGYYRENEDVAAQQGETGPPQQDQVVGTFKKKGKGHGYYRENQDILLEGNPKDDNLEPSDDVLGTFKKHKKGKGGGYYRENQDILLEGNPKGDNLEPSDDVLGTFKKHKKGKGGGYYRENQDILLEGNPKGDNLEPSDDVLGTFKKHKKGKGGGYYRENQDILLEGNPKGDNLEPSDDVLGTFKKHKKGKGGGYYRENQDILLEGNPKGDNLEPSDDVLGTFKKHKKGKGGGYYRENQDILLEGNPKGDNLEPSDDVLGTFKKHKKGKGGGYYRENQDILLEGSPKGDNLEPINDEDGILGTFKKHKKEKGYGYYRDNEEGGNQASENGEDGILGTFKKKKGKGHGYYRENGGGENSEVNAETESVLGTFKKHKKGDEYEYYRENEAGDEQGGNHEQIQPEEGLLGTFKKSKKGKGHGYYREGDEIEQENGELDILGTFKKHKKDKGHGYYRENEGGEREPMNNEEDILGTFKKKKGGKGHGYYRENDDAANDQEILGTFKKKGKKGLGYYRANEESGPALKERISGKNAEGYGEDLPIYAPVYTPEDHYEVPQPPPGDQYNSYPPESYGQDMGEQSYQQSYQGTYDAPGYVENEPKNLYPVEVKDDLPVYSLVDNVENNYDNKDYNVGAPQKAAPVKNEVEGDDWYKREYYKLKELLDQVKNTDQPDALTGLKNLEEFQSRFKENAEAGAKSAFDTAAKVVDGAKKLDVKSMVADVKPVANYVLDTVEKGLQADPKVGRKEPSERSAENNDTVGCSLEHLFDKSSEEEHMYLEPAKPMYPYYRSNKADPVLKTLDKILHPQGKQVDPLDTIRNALNPNKQKEGNLLPSLIKTLENVKVELPTIRPSIHKHRPHEPTEENFAPPNYPPPQMQDRPRIMPESRFAPQRPGFEMVGSPYPEFSPGMEHFGKIVPAHVHDLHSRDVSDQKKPDKMYFVGDGIKLPLHMKKHEDGTLHLSVDVKKLCKCNSTLCKNGEPHFDDIVGASLTSTTDKTTTEAGKTKISLLDKLKLKKNLDVVKRSPNSEENDYAVPIHNLKTRINTLVDDFKRFKKEQDVPAENQIDDKNMNEPIKKRVGILADLLGWMKGMAVEGKKIYE